MEKIVRLIVCGMLLAASCGGLKVGGGLRGVECGKDLMTLDGDTFKVRETLGDSLLVVSQYHDGERCYLIKREWNGLYYVQQEGNSFHTIDNTQDYICVDDKKVYCLSNNSSFPLPCWAYYLLYLGQWGDKAAFVKWEENMPSTNRDTIFFSDGKCIALRGGADCKPSATKGNVVLQMGARRMDLPIGELYQYEGKTTAEQQGVERFEKNYYIVPRSQYESVEAGFAVDLDIPTGNADSDNAIRQWLLKVIKVDVFSLYDSRDISDNIPTGNSGSVRDVTDALDRYATLWEKLCRAEYQEEDTLIVRMMCDVRSRKIVDCDDYTTYYYWCATYNGGLHEMPRSYYVTYDKKRKTMLTTDNTVKANMRISFREEALRSIKPLYDEYYEEASEWDDFQQAVFSFHCPLFDMSEWDEIARSLLENDYACDEWSGWQPVNTEPFTLRNFPLPHLALLPEGIVLSYHPYQIDCFVAGEYHAVIPYEKVSGCLQYEYHGLKDDLPKLEQFVR